MHHWGYTGAYEIAEDLRGITTVLERMSLGKQIAVVFEITKISSS